VTPLPIGRRAAFLDRDGVLNRAIVRDGLPYPPQSLAEMEMAPGAADLLARLRNAGFLLLVVTNQPDVARGRQVRETVEAMHAAMAAHMPVDDFLVCFHDDRDACPCRKPKPGLLLTGAERYGISLAASYMVGDRWRDIDAGAAAGCRTVFLDFHYAERGPTSPANATVSSLAEAVDWILADRLTSSTAEAVSTT
jgi:D-glycero-D-manno-heptose 1,7-bisphosphate phosphatase